MHKLSVGLIGKGGETWIAGINYISSIVYANGLLPTPESLDINLFLYERTQKLKFY